MAMKPWEIGYILFLNTCDVIREPYCGPTQVLSTGKLLNSTSYEQQRGVTTVILNPLFLNLGTLKSCPRSATKFVSNVKLGIFTSTVS